MQSLASITCAPSGALGKVAIEAITPSAMLISALVPLARVPPLMNSFWLIVRSPIPQFQQVTSTRLPF